MRSESDLTNLILDAHEGLNPDRELLLSRRGKVARRELPNFVDETQALREDLGWRVCPASAEYADRRVEVELPATEAALTAAMASAARGCIADLGMESDSPDADDAAHEAISAAVSLGDRARSRSGPTLVTRPRALQTRSQMPGVGGDLSASIIDVARQVWSCAPRVRGGRHLYFDIPGIEHFLEARWWNELLSQLELQLALAPGSLRVRVAIETLPAAFQMDEILWELRTRSIGLAADLDAYIESAAEVAGKAGVPAPDRLSASMKDPFAVAYLTRIIRTCHLRGTHAIGPRVPFTDQGAGDDPAQRLSQAYLDADWIAISGFDGATTADLELIDPIINRMDSILGGRANQLRVLPPETPIERDDLVGFATKPLQALG